MQRFIAAVLIVFIMVSVFQIDPSFKEESTKLSAIGYEVPSKVDDIDQNVELFVNKVPDTLDVVIIQNGEKEAIVSEKVDEEAIVSEKVDEEAIVSEKVEEESVQDVLVNDRLGEPDVLTEQVVEVDPVFELDAYILSYLSAEDFDKILENTPLEGLGYAFVKIEEEYSVNGLFAISVCQLESGLGKYQANKNNFFGFYYNGRYMSFDTPEKGILYFGKLISGSIYAGRSIDSIAKTYCPPNPKWAPTVKQIMKENWDKVV